MYVVDLRHRQNRGQGAEAHSADQRDRTYVVVPSNRLGARHWSRFRTPPTSAPFTDVTAQPAATPAHARADAGVRCRTRPGRDPRCSATAAPAHRPPPKLTAPGRGRMDSTHRSVVIGRHWNRWNSPREKPHSMSTGQPIVHSSDRATRATSIACAAVRDSIFWRAAETATCWVP